MKQVFAWIEYGSKCVAAISEALKVLVANWPVDHPGSQSAKEK